MTVSPGAFSPASSTADFNCADATGGSNTIGNTTPAGFLGCASAIQTFDYEARLPTIKSPTLVICGDEDPGTPPERNKLIASKIPGGRYEGIANARHLPNVERPEQFNRIMMGWLAANR